MLVVECVADDCHEDAELASFVVDNALSDGDVVVIAEIYAEAGLELMFAADDVVVVGMVEC